MNELTLSSDILAELPVPSSNILTYEEDMPSPDLAVAISEGFDSFIVESYSAQLYMRKHLNLIHRMFYRPNTECKQILKCWKLNSNIGYSFPDTREKDRRQKIHNVGCYRGRRQ